MSQRRGREQGTGGGRRFRDIDAGHHFYWNGDAPKGSSAAGEICQKLSAYRFTVVATGVEFALRPADVDLEVLRRRARKA